MHSRRGQPRRQARAVIRGEAETSVLDRYTRQRRKAQLDYVQRIKGTQYLFD